MRTVTLAAALATAFLCSVSANAVADTCEMPFAEMPTDDLKFCSEQLLQGGKGMGIQALYIIVRKQEAIEEMLRRCFITVNRGGKSDVQPRRPCLPPKSPQAQ